MAREGLEPSKPLGRQIYSLLRLTASLPRQLSVCLETLFPERFQSDGAGEGIRTPDLLITNQLLYRPELRQPKQKWNYSTSYATGTILVLSTIGGSRGRLTAALANGFEKRDPGGDGHVQALDVPPHRYRRQPIAPVPDQATQPGSLSP